MKKIFAYSIALFFVSSMAVAFLTPIGGGGGGGITWSTPVNSSVIPDTANVYDFGSSALPFREIFVSRVKDWNSGFTSVDNISRFLVDSSNVTSFNWDARQIFDTSNLISFDGNQRQLFTTGGQTSVNWQNRQLFDPGSVLSIDWNGRQLRDSAGQPSGDWLNRELADTSGVQSILWGDRQLRDSALQPSANWNNRTLRLATDIGTVDWQNTFLADTTGTQALEWTTRAAIDSGGANSIDWSNRTLIDPGTTTSLHWQNRFLADENGDIVLSWEDGGSGKYINWPASLGGVIQYNISNGTFQDQVGTTSIDINGRTLVDDLGGAAFLFTGTEHVLFDTIGERIFGSNGGNTLSVKSTVTPGGTTGNQTINKPQGTVNFGGGATSLVVTNSTITTDSIVHAIARTNDATCSVKNVVSGTGSFTINMTAACSAETSVGFLVLNNY